MSDETSGGQVTIAGKLLTCQFCGYDQFEGRQAQLNTAAASFFGFDWANASAECYVCSQCGYIHWFLPR